VGSGSAGVGDGSGAVLVTAGAIEGSWTGSWAGSWVAAGVGSCTAVNGTAGGAFDGSGSACGVCDSGAGVGVSAAEGVDVGVGAGAAGAAPGLRLAALGANFLPVVFSNYVLAGLPRSHCRHSLLIKELKLAAALGGGAWLDASSADMFVLCLLRPVCGKEGNMRPHTYSAGKLGGSGSVGVSVGVHGVFERVGASGGYVS
jgi:hypothetical protein